MKRTSLSIISTIVALISLAIWVFLLYSVKTKEAGVSVLATELLTKEEERKQLASLKALAEDVGDSMQIIDRAFVARDGIAKFVEELEILGRNEGVKIEIADLSVDEGGDSPVKKLRMRVDITGSLSSVTSTINTIETLEKIMTIGRASLTRFDGEKGVVFWKAGLDVSANLIH